MALAGAEDGLWSIKGGNWKLVEKLIQTSGSIVVHERVKFSGLLFACFALFVFSHLFVHALLTWA